MEKGEIGYSESYYTTLVGKDWKNCETRKLAILSHSQPLQWQKFGKVGKLAILSHSAPLQWEKIGKVVKWAKLAPLWWEKIGKVSTFSFPEGGHVDSLVILVTQSGHLR